VRHKLVRLAAVAAALAVGIGVYVLGRTVGEMRDDQNSLSAVAAFVGVLAVLRPGAFFVLDAPRWWFSGTRPAPSSAYLLWSRIGGVVMVVGSVLAVVFLSEPDPSTVPGLDP
jgi:hypothetical protein